VIPVLPTNITHHSSQITKWSSQNHISQKFTIHHIFCVFDAEIATFFTTAISFAKCLFIVTQNAITNHKIVITTITNHKSQNFCDDDFCDFG
jgi:hypothetical protein